VDLGGVGGSMERELQYKRQEVHRRNKDADTGDSMFSSYRNSAETAYIFRDFKINCYDLILEVGSGTGRFTVEFAKRGAEVVALDYSVDSLKINKSRCECHVLLADLCFLPFKDSVFDKAAGIAVFQHVPPRSRIAGLKEIRRVSKEGAEFLITVYNNRLWDKIRGEKQGFHGGLIYYYRFDISELRQLILSVFSKIVDIHTLLLIEEYRILRLAFRFLYRTGLVHTPTYISFMVLIGKMPLFSLLGDHILLVCES